MQYGGNSLASQATLGMDALHINNNPQSQQAALITAVAQALVSTAQQSSGGAAEQLSSLINSLKAATNGLAAQQQ